MITIATQARSLFNETRRPAPRDQQLVGSGSISLPKVVTASRERAK
jgi:hypothetical protein